MLYINHFVKHLVIFISWFSYILAYNFSNTTTIINNKVTNNITPGIAVAVSYNNNIIYNYTYGTLSKTSNMSINTNTIFDVASLTKPLIITTIMLNMLNSGIINLNDTVSTYLPEFSYGNDAMLKNTITIQHLLNHTSGLTPWLPLYLNANNKQQALQFIAQTNLQHPPNSKTLYSDLGFILLTLIIEKIYNKPIDIVAQEVIFNPLLLTNTTYNPKNNANIAVTSFGDEFEEKTTSANSLSKKFKWRKYFLQGEVNDGNAFYIFKGASGHAGLFTNTTDIIKIITYILQHPQANLIFNKPFSNNTYNNGFEVNNNKYMPNNIKYSSVGHLGFTGTCLLVNKQHNLIIIILTNKQNYGLNNNNKYLNSAVICTDIIHSIVNELKLN